MKKIHNIYSGGVRAVMLFLWGAVPFAAMAENTNSSTPLVTATIKNPTGVGDLMALLQLVLTSIVMPVAAVVSVVYIIWAGFKYVTAQGNEKAIQEAHANLLWALVGVGVLLGATGISQVIQTTVNSVIK